MSSEDSETTNQSDSQKESSYEDDSPYPDESPLGDGDAASSGESDSDRRDADHRRAAAVAGKRKLDQVAHDGNKPLKRRRGTFYPDYLEILNQDIADAANHMIQPPTLHPSGKVIKRLPDTQLGLSRWTHVEKTLFFEAVARLGRDDLPGISARMGATKSPLEIRQYLIFLADAAAQPAREETRPLRGRELGPSDFPAAAELSEECCAALEEAADAVSVRAETDEDVREEARWGRWWDITAEMAEEMERRAQGDALGEEEEEKQKEKDGDEEDPLPRFAEFFVLPTWIELSTRVFMNGTSPDQNWETAGNHLPPVGKLYTQRHWRDRLSDAGNRPPSVRATALEDFHALVVAVTRRLVMAALFVASSRERTPKAEVAREREKRERRPGDGEVRRPDVAAAAASLGLNADGREFWRRCPRRLGLRVYRKMKKMPRVVKFQRKEPVESMSYDEVERELGWHIPRGVEGDGHIATPAVEDVAMLSGSESPSEDEAEASDSESLDTSENEPIDGRGDEMEDGHDDDLGLDEQAIEDDVQEFLVYTGHSISIQRAEKEVRRRLRDEHVLERYADAQDMLASHAEELHLWQTLEREPPRGLVKPEPLGKPPMGDHRPPEELLRAGEATDWRKRLGYYGEWETIGGRDGTSRPFREGQAKRLFEGYVGKNELPREYENKEAEAAVG